MRHLSWVYGVGSSCNCEVGADHPGVVEIDLSSEWQIVQLAECHARHEDADATRPERMRLALEEFLGRGVA